MEWEDDDTAATANGTSGSGSNATPDDVRRAAIEAASSRVRDMAMGDMQEALDTLQHLRAEFEAFVMGVDGSVGTRVILDALFLMIAGAKWESARMSFTEETDLFVEVLHAMSQWDPNTAYPVVDVAEADGGDALQPTSPGSHDAGYDALYPYFSSNFYPECSPDGSRRLGRVAEQLFKWCDGAYTLLSLAR